MLQNLVSSNRRQLAHGRKICKIMPVFALNVSDLSCPTISQQKSLQRCCGSRSGRSMILRRLALCRARRLWASYYSLGVTSKPGLRVRVSGLLLLRLSVCRRFFSVVMTLSWNGHFGNRRLGSRPISMAALMDLHDSRSRKGWQQGFTCMMPVKTAGTVRSSSAAFQRCPSSSWNGRNGSVV